jgi:hypothetical protein
VQRQRVRSSEEPDSVKLLEDARAGRAGVLSQHETVASSAVIGSSPALVIIGEPWKCWSASY